MNFLKITGLIIGTGSVVGGTGAGIYYVANKKTQFVGKLVFEKKTATDNNGDYEIKLLTKTEYTEKEKEFNKDKTQENTKYAEVNKVIEISHALKFSELETRLKKILGADISLTNAKQKISSEKVTELKELLGEEIYASLKNKFNS